MTKTTKQCVYTAISIAMFTGILWVLWPDSWWGVLLGFMLRGGMNGLLWIWFPTWMMKDSLWRLSRIGGHD